MTPCFLDLQQILSLHLELVERYGGSQGVRDIGMLQSAIAMPQSAFGGEYMHADLFEMAAAYMYHLVQNHPFVDGNKRIGSASAIVFLYMNGIEIEADEDGLTDLTIRVASNAAGKGEIASFFRERAT